MVQAMQLLKDKPEDFSGDFRRRYGDTTYGFGRRCRGNIRYRSGISERIFSGSNTGIRRENCRRLYPTLQTHGKHRPHLRRRQSGRDQSSMRAIGHNTGYRTPTLGKGQRLPKRQNKKFYSQFLSLKSSSLFCFWACLASHGCSLTPMHRSSGGPNVGSTF